MDEFWQSIASGKTDQLQRLLDSDSSLLESRSSSGNSPLKLACNAGQVESTRVLLRNGANPDARLTHVSPVSGRKESGVTALMFARKVELVRLLVESGADVNAEDDDGRRVLNHIGMRLNAGLLTCLVSLGAKLREDDVVVCLERARDELAYRSTGQVGPKSDRRIELEETIEWCECQLQQLQGVGE